MESWSHGYYHNLGHLFPLSPGFAQTEDGGPLPERRPVLLELNGRDTDFICGRLDRRLFALSSNNSDAIGGGDRRQDNLKLGADGPRVSSSHSASARHTNSSNHGKRRKIRRTPHDAHRASKTSIKYTVHRTPDFIKKIGTNRPILYLSLLPRASRLAKFSSLQPETTWSRML